MDIFILISFLFFTLLVAFLTWFLTRKQDMSSKNGYFLAGRNLSFPLIAGSLLLTNLSTEQMVGLNGAAFKDGFAVMVWEVGAVVALLAMALFFLPRFLKSGVTTVPEYLKIRFGARTEFITNIIMLSAYALILLPIILYTGAVGLIGILGLQNLLGIESYSTVLVLVIIAVGIIGSLYALTGGLRTVAVSDTLNGIALLVGGFLITFFGFRALGGGNFISGIQALGNLVPKHMNSIGGPDTSVPFSTVFSGVMLLNFFYWTTNQQIIQRTFGAKSLAEGQKGVLLTGGLKLLGPLYLVLPGIIAFALFAGQNIKADHAYGMLVNHVLPTPLAGFFAAAMLGAILSSFNSALNSTCTLFSLGIYKEKINPKASEKKIVRSGRIFGIALAAFAMIVAPILAKTGSIFSYLQKMNGIYFIPIFAVVLVGMLTKRVPSKAANVGLLSGIGLIAIGYFVPPFDKIVTQMHEYHFLGLIFAYLIIMMLIMGETNPRKTEFIQEDVKAVDMTPWKHAKLISGIILAIIITIFVVFADFSVLG
ncbi:MAG: solute:sodium symporter family transporter [Candidatus Marinimicrobia bacterium]|nr:solute:sodium symporter family transporter [Candidatus Neomarinimicrobiota bacterium]